LDHANATFTSKRDYEIHIQKEHSDASKYLRSPELLKAGESTRLQSDRPCPICGKEMPFALDLQYHIALHLERLALYSLPRSTGREDDSQDASDWSDQVNGGRDSSKSELLSTSVSVDSVEEVGLEQRERVEDQSRSIDNPEGTPIDQIERGVAHLDSDIKHQELTAASLSVQAKEQDHTRKVEAFLEDQVPSLDHENLLNSTTGSAQHGPFDISWDQDIQEVRKLDEERKQRQEEFEAKLDDLFTRNEISYSELADMEADFKLAEAERRAEEDKMLLQTTGVPEILSPGARLPGWEELSTLREGGRAPPPPRTMESPESHRILTPTPRNLQLACGRELGVQLTFEIAEGICALYKVNNGTDAERREAFENAFNFTKDWSDLFHRLSQKARDDASALDGMNPLESHDGVLGVPDRYLPQADLICPFQILDCEESFSDIRLFKTHVFSHFRGQACPTSATCFLCEAKFIQTEEDDAARAWNEMLSHLAYEHFRRGQRLATVRADFGLMRWMYARRIITDAQFKRLQLYPRPTIAPASPGARIGEVVNAPLAPMAPPHDQEYLSILDFSKGVSRFGYRLNHTVVRTIFQSFVGRETELQQARMTFSQFVTACVWLKQSTDVFKQFDDDRDGYVTLSFEEALGSWMELGAGGVVKNDEGILGTSKQGASALRVVN
jgi:hypothetical protein